MRKQFGSSLLAFLDVAGLENENLIAWSDICTGQNKNLCALWQYLIATVEDLKDVCHVNFQKRVYWFYLTYLISSSA